MQVESTLDYTGAIHAQSDGLLGDQLRGRGPNRVGARPTSAGVAPATACTASRAPSTAAPFTPTPGHSGRARSGGAAAGLGAVIGLGLAKYLVV